jgi:hypothetical protein
MLVPDFLAHCSRTFFERDGFCFTISLDREDGAAMFTIMFQNRYTGRSIARVALRPSGSSLAVSSPPIKCGPAGFGVIKFPVAIPARHEGKAAIFQLAAQVDYPQGKGREVRFLTGRSVPNSLSCNDRPGIINALPRFVAERIFGHAFRTVRLKLPNDVVDYVPEEATGHAEELWSMTRS